MSFEKNVKKMMTFTNTIIIIDPLLRDLGHSKMHFTNVFPVIKSIQSSNSKVFITAGQLLLVSLKTH